MAGRSQIEKNEEKQDLVKYIRVNDSEGNFYNVDVNLPEGCLKYIENYNSSIDEIDTTDIESVKNSAMESLILMMQAKKGDIKSLPIVREVLDRYIGKPVQPIAQKVQHSIERNAGSAMKELESLSVDKLKAIRELLANE